MYWSEEKKEGFYFYYCIIQLATLSLFDDQGKKKSEILIEG